MTNFGGVLMASIRRYHPSVADDLSAATAYYDEFQPTLEIGSERLFADAYAMQQNDQNPLDAFRTKCGSRF